jgi:ectoine hydroxylase-related dioxygenase (phytanoyl-CoA dioxygenase family)
MKWRLPKALPHYFNARVIAGSYVVKEHNLQCIVPPHQDWSFVDNEGEYCSVTCWIPLVDTTLENGAMGVIKGSHVMLGNIRSSPSPQVPTPLMDHQFTIFPYLEMIEMKAGEALVFDHRTFHASTPNTTNQPRVAIRLRVYSARRHDLSLHNEAKRQERYAAEVLC